MTYAFTADELVQLAKQNGAPAVSLYMTTHVTGRARRQDEIRLKNLLRDASAQLRGRGTDKPTCDAILHPIEQLPKDPVIWEHRNEGLAAFSTNGLFVYRFVPKQFGELVVVDEQFHVTPLLSLLNADARYFILALTKDSARLYEATRSTIHNLDLPELRPITVDGNERPLQYHSHNTAGAGTSGSDESIFHGQGGSEDREKVDIANFFKRQVAPCIADALQNEQAPLVLACVDHLAPIYREANSYGSLVDEHVSGSPAELNDNELRDKAFDIVRSFFQSATAQAKAQYEKLASTERTSQDKDAICAAAQQGRIDTLFVQQDVLAPDADNRTWDLPSMEAAAKQTLLKSGRVLVVDEVPGQRGLAAILRY